MSHLRSLSTWMCLLMALALRADPVGAQSLLDRFIIRQDLDTKHDVPQPAFFQVTSPENKPAVISAGIGVIGKIVDNPLVTFGPSFEYLRSTALAKPVDSLKGGAALEWQTRLVDPSGQGAADSPVINAKVNYVRDGTKETSGFQALAVYTHVFVGKRSRFLPNNEHQFHRELTAIYSPDVGLEFQQDSASAKSTGGHALRAVAEVTISVYPSRTALEQKLEVTASISSRSDMVKTFDYADRQHTLSTAAVNYYLLKQAKRSAGFGITLTHGEDPGKGFEQQHVWQFGLRLQFK